MAKLILSMDGQVLREHVLSKERTLIGRKPHNDVVIDNLAVSGEHAAIITILNDSFIEDLNSTNGTFVNGKPIKKHFLQNNDVVEIGKHKLKYFNEQLAAAGGADFEKTMIIRNPSAMRGPGDPPPIPVVGGPTSTQTQAPSASMGNTSQNAVLSGTGAPLAAGAVKDAAIQVLSGAAAGRSLDLTKNLTTIGKPGVQVAVITKRPNGYFITHVEGASFPLINGKEIGPQAVQLNDHDTVELAGTKMEFFYKP